MKGRQNVFLGIFLTTWAQFSPERSYAIVFLLFAMKLFFRLAQTRQHKCSNYQLVWKPWSLESKKNVLDDDKVPITLRPCLRHLRAYSLQARTTVWLRLSEKKTALLWTEHAPGRLKLALRSINNSILYIKGQNGAWGNSFFERNTGGIKKTRWVQINLKRV